MAYDDGDDDYDDDVLYLFLFKIYFIFSGPLLMKQNAFTAVRQGREVSLSNKLVPIKHISILCRAFSFIGRARLNDNVSVYATELTAILHALIWIKSNNREFSNYVIF